MIPYNLAGGFCSSDGKTSAVITYDGEIRVNNNVVRKSQFLFTPYHPTIAREVLEDFLRENKYI